MKTFLVGGAVRDQLLQYPYTEKDWVVTGATPEIMIEQGFTPVGKDFPVFLHPQTHEEYALARTERKTAPGYKGFTFHTSTDVTLEEDLQRRDLTINAIAQDSDGQLIDPYHGQQDIQNRCLRHVSNAFSEDPVRVLRLGRFVARYHHLGFSVAKETIELIHEMVKAGETQHLVAERVWQECHKALKEKHPEQFIILLKGSQALHDIMPEIDGDHLQECQTLLARCSQDTTEAVIRFAALCYPLPLEHIEQLCQRISAPKEFAELAILTKRHYALCTNSQPWTAENLNTLFSRTDALRKGERFQQLLNSCMAIYVAIEQSSKNNHQPQTEHPLLSALTCYKDVNIQALIAQGYEKAELGKAISRSRQEQLAAWLKSS